MLNGGEHGSEFARTSEISEAENEPASSSSMSKRPGWATESRTDSYFAFPGFGAGLAAAAAAIPATVAESGTAATDESFHAPPLLWSVTMYAPGIVNVCPPGPGTWVAVVPVETAMSPEI